MPERKERRLFGEFFTNLIHKLSENEKKIYSYLGFFLILILVLAGLDLLNIRKIFAFMLFVMIGGAFKYLISRYKIWFEFTPIVFFAVLIGKYMGLFWVIPYIIVADIMSAFLAGTGPTGGSVPYWLWMFIITIIAKPFDIIGAGQILIPLIYFLGCLLLEQFIKGGLNPWRWGSSIANLIINLYFFLKLSNFFIMLMT